MQNSFRPAYAFGNDSNITRRPRVAIRRPVSSRLRAEPAPESPRHVRAATTKCVIDQSAPAPLAFKNALTLLHQASGGTLRTLGIIANATLMQAFTTRSPQVEAEHVPQVIQR